MRNNSSRSLQNFFYGTGCPVTIALILINVIAFFINETMQGTMGRLLVFSGDRWFQHPWTLVTWSLIGGDPISLLFASLWTYWVCGSLERSWGFRTFLAFFAAMSAIMALSVWAGAMLLHLPTDFLLGGLFLALAAPTVAWCTVNRRESVCVWGILTVPAPYIGWFSAIMAWYDVSHLTGGGPLLGLFGLVSCAAAYWYASFGRYAFRGYASGGWFGGGRGPGGRPNLKMQTFGSERETVSSGAASWGPLRQLRAWQERRRLEKLWKRSFSDGSNDPKKR